MDSFQNIESVLGKKQSSHNFQEIRLNPLWADMLTKLIRLILNSWFGVNYNIIQFSLKCKA